MGRRGWVTAEDAAGDWWRPAVFDDGWVELPGPARSSSDTRTQLRRSLGSAGAISGRPAGTSLRRAAREAGRSLRRRPGSPLLRRASSSAELASWLGGVRLVGAEEVGVVEIAAPPGPSDQEPVAVSVRLHDGRSLTYRTPDRKAVGLFAAWTR